MFTKILKFSVLLLVITISVVWFELNILKPLLDATSRTRVIRQFKDFPVSLRESIQVNMKREEFLTRIKDREWPFRMNLMPKIFLETIQDMFHLSQAQVKELTETELEILAHRTFDILDRDRDGTFSSTENDLLKRLGYQMLFDVPSACRIPGEVEGTKLISISLGEGTAISSVTAHDQETVTTAAEVWVEPQKRPLRLVLMSWIPIIWQIRGTKDNIVHVILNNPASGITGMEREKVRFIDSWCLPHYFDHYTGKGLLVRSAMIQVLGQVPDFMESDLEGGLVTISHNQVHFAPVITKGKDFSDRKIVVPSGFDPESWSRLLQYYPDGVTYIDPASVFSKAPVETYEVLPLEAGIAQLVHDGVIIPIPGAYSIVKDIIRIPPGLYDWYRFDRPRFRLSPGVKVLEGSLKP